MVNAIATIVIVLVILWLALRSRRIILAVFLNLFVGLAVTAALGLMMVGALNLISVAFAVLFVGLGVDFGIQFAVRYRSERFEHGDLQAALGSTAEKIGAPLTLAAAAVAAGFLSFCPDRLQGRLRARPDRRHRHADRLCHQHHRAARAAHHPASRRARRRRSAIACWRRSTASWSATASR